MKNMMYQDLRLIEIGWDREWSKMTNPPGRRWSGFEIDLDGDWLRLRWIRNEEDDVPGFEIVWDREWSKMTNPPGRRWYTRTWELVPKSCPGSPQGQAGGEGSGWSGICIGIYKQVGQELSRVQDQSSYPLLVLVNWWCRLKIIWGSRFQILFILIILILNSKVNSQYQIWEHLWMEGSKGPSHASAPVVGNLTTILLLSVYIVFQNSSPLVSLILTLNSFLLLSVLPMWISRRQAPLQDTWHHWRGSPCSRHRSPRVSQTHCTLWRRLIEK